MKFKSFVTTFSVALLLGIPALTSISPIVVNASENTPEIRNSSVSLPLGSNQQTYEEQTVKDEKGNDIGKIIIENTTIQPRIISASPLSNQTYSVKFISGSLNVGYKVRVSNKKIVSAHSPWTNGLLWTADLGRISYNSTTATLHGRAILGFKGFGANTTFRLIGRISGNQFISDVKVP